ncbi:hypothetical protein Tco_0582274, partial [Tanacetum coccineum]
SEHPKDKTGLDTATKLARAKPNKRSRYADLLKDKPGLELLAPSKCSSVKGQSDKGTVLVKDHCPWKDTWPTSHTKREPQGYVL